MSNNEFVFGILVVLTLLSSSHSFFGKNLSKPIWWLSIISSALEGIALGFLVTNEFPTNLFCGTALAIPTVGLTLIMRQTRKRHER